MISYEGIFDGETIKKSTRLVDKSDAKLQEICRKLERESNPTNRRNLYTKILLDENVEDMLNKISAENFFREDFPEFYVKNKYNENVINCSQNNSYHRYSVFKHILNSIENVAKNNEILGEYKIELLKWTMLLHDIGKPYVKFTAENGIESFAKHDEKSVELATDILKRFEFTDYEKNIILTLIKYHDKFLNEGEIIYNNLKLLAEELNNNKENFHMLIEVKDADAKAKSIEVYNKYIITRSKYLEFSEIYFKKIAEIQKVESKKNKEEIIEEEISDIEYGVLIDQVISRKNITNLYQPIVNIKEMKVIGYEIFSRINHEKNIDVKKFISYAKSIEKHLKIEQALFINAMESFERIKTKETNTAFINFSVNGYTDYINKPRIYDAMERFKLVIEFNNYENSDVIKISNEIHNINAKKGLISIDDFGTSYLQIDDLKLVRPNYIKIDKDIIKDVLTDNQKENFIKELVTAAFSKDIVLIAMGVETKEIFDKLVTLGIENFQGYYIATPKEYIDNINLTLNEVLNDGTNDSIV